VTTIKQNKLLQDHLP